MLDGAVRRLAAARAALDADPSTAVSAAYYAMLYAARAALSERGRHARTHGGTWQLFHEELVSTGAFDPRLARAAARQQEAREQADYEAAVSSPESALAALELAERFLSAVRESLEP